MSNEPKVKLYEISALVTYSVVVAATSREDAQEHVKTWEQAWHSTGDLICVSDVELSEERDVMSANIDDEANDVTAAAQTILDKEKVS